MAKDRILVSTQEMTATIQRYNNARSTMDEAFANMEAAMNHLDNCWEGPAKTAYRAKWAVIYGNIKRSDEAMEMAITGLTNTIAEMENADSQANQAASGLEQGKAAPTVGNYF